MQAFIIENHEEYDFCFIEYCAFDVVEQGKMYSEDLRGMFNEGNFVSNHCADH